jgi:hypothetical protein
MRERLLRAGHMERHGPIIFYWEPHSEWNGKGYDIKQSFTIDYGGARIRLELFDTAVKVLEEMKLTHAVDIAVTALGLRRLH